jgi:hypothetical protein
MGQYLKDVSGAMDYIIDSFPVAVCDNIRIAYFCVIVPIKCWL